MLKSNRGADWGNLESYNCRLLSAKKLEEEEHGYKLWYRWEDGYSLRPLCEYPDGSTKEVSGPVEFWSIVQGNDTC